MSEARASQNKLRPFCSPRIVPLDKRMFGLFFFGFFFYLFAILFLILLLFYNVFFSILFWKAFVILVTYFEVLFLLHCNQETLRSSSSSLRFHLLLFCNMFYLVILF